MRGFLGAGLLLSLALSPSPARSAAVIAAAGVQAPAAGGFALVQPDLPGWAPALPDLGRSLGQVLGAPCLPDARALTPVLRGLEAQGIRAAAFQALPAAERRAGVALAVSAARADGARLAEAVLRGNLPRAEVPKARAELALLALHGGYLFSADDLTLIRDASDKARSEALGRKSARIEAGVRTTASIWDVIAGGYAGKETPSGSGTREETRPETLKEDEPPAGPRPAPAPAPDPADAAFARSCELELAGLAPDAAHRLLRDERLLRLLESQPSLATRLVERASAVADIDEQIAANKESESLRDALLLRLRTGSPAASAGIGPSPESLLRWTASHRPGKLELVRAALLDWGSLLPGQQGHLRARGLDSGPWAALDLPRRLSELAGWARGERADLLESSPAALDRAGAEKEAARAEAAARLLAGGERDELYRHAGNLRVLARAREAIAAALAEGHDVALRKALDTLDGMGTGPVAARLDYLSRALAAWPRFRDLGLVRELDSGRASREGEAFTDSDRQALAARLEGLLLEEAAGTIAGDRVRSFYSGARLALRVRSLPGMVAGYSPLGKDMSLGEEALQEWLREKGLTSSALLSDAGALRRLARMVSPMFVHEATHQMQDAWLAREGLHRSFTQEEEIEAYTMETLFVIEKSLRDARFLGDVRQDEREAADRLREDIGLFRSIVRRIYSDLPSFRMTAAANLSLAAALAAEQARRLALPPAESARVEKGAWGSQLDYLLEKGMATPQSALSMKSSDLARWEAYLRRWYAAASRRLAETRAWAERTLGELIERQRSISRI